MVPLEPPAAPKPTPQVPPGGSAEYHLLPASSWRVPFQIYGWRSHFGKQNTKSIAVGHRRILAWYGWSFVACTILGGLRWDLQVSMNIYFSVSCWSRFIKILMTLIMASPFPPDLIMGTASCGILIPGWSNVDSGYLWIHTYWPALGSLVMLAIS